jgi:predicted porin
LEKFAMKKSLIALAALAATTAFAQSSVTISGTLDAGLMNQKFENATNVTNVSSGTNGASRLRFVGVEDIGNGTKANFWLEMQPNFQDGTTSSSGLFNRGAWLGLSDTTFGEIRLGRQGTNSVAAVCDIDQQGCYTGVSGGGILFSGIASAGGNYSYWMAANPTRGGIAQNNGLNTSVLASSTGGANQTNTAAIAVDSTRYVRSVRYSLPTFVPGLGINASYAFGQALVTGGHSGDSMGEDANYVNGPLKLTAAYQKANGERVATAGSATTAATLGPIGASGELTTIGAVYNFGFMSLGAGYQSEKANATSANTGTSALQFTKGEGYALTALFPLGAFTPYIKYGERKYSGGTLNTFTPTKMTNVGVRYALSKRTYVYGDYVQNGSDVIVPGATQLFNQGSLQNQTNFGITHAV